MHWQNLVHVVAFSNGIFLTISLLFVTKFANRQAQYSLVFFMAGLAALLAIFTFVDAGWLKPSAVVQGGHDLIALLVPAFFLHYIYSISNDTHSPWFFYIPGATFLAALIISPQWVLVTVRLEHIVILQVCASAWASVKLFQYFHGKHQWPQHLVALIGYLWLLHLTQLLRMYLPQSNIVFDAVPLVGSTLFIVLTILVLNDKQIFHRLLSISKSKLDENSELFSRLESIMSDSKPWLDADLSLSHFAQLAGLPERQISEVLTSKQLNFFQFINRYRIEEAQRLLVCEEESRTSVEAIALMVGFRSRSAFYESFRKEVGCTPASFRKQKEPSSPN